MKNQHFAPSKPPRQGPARAIWNPYAALLAPKPPSNCSFSLGLGATGMTFFDDAVTAFFSPDAAGKSLMFLVGLGRTGTPNRVRPFRSKYGVLKDSLARGAGGERRPVPDWLYSN